MKPHLVSFLDRLNSSASLEAAWDETVAYAFGIGAEWVHYAYAPSPARPSEVWPRLTNLPESWLEHYKKSGFSAVNSSAHHCRDSVRPILAGPDFVKPSLDRRHRCWLDDSRSLGIVSEVVIPLRGLPAAGFGGFTFATRLSASEARSWAANLIPELLVAIQFADSRLLQLAREKETTRIGLSPREREVLLWLAAGYRNDRIAERMRISNPTVELHLSKARKKLNAATREQAVALAVLLGAISP